MNINRKLNNISLIIISLSCISLFTGCQKNNSLKLVEQFIHTQINCETYKEANGDPVLLKQTFLDFFEEQAYEKYLSDIFGYMYPQIFDIAHADRVQIDKIKYKEIVKQSDGLSKYQIEVRYTIVSRQQQKEEVQYMSMKDQLEITVSEDNKITEVIILNTSDIIKKLFLDIKVQ